MMRGGGEVGVIRARGLTIVTWKMTSSLGA